MGNWRPFTLSLEGLYASAQEPNGHSSEPTDDRALEEAVLSEILASVGGHDPCAERRERLKAAGCDVDRLSSLRTRTALLEGATPGDGVWARCASAAELLRELVRDLLRCRVAPDRVEEVLRASGCAQLVRGHWERVGPLVERCQREMAREAAQETWREPPTDGGTDDMVLCAAVGLTRERGMWVIAPAERASVELARWVTDQGLPLPPDWPRTGRAIGFALRRVRDRLTVAGVWWKKGRIGGRESNGARPTFYLFCPWGYGGKQDTVGNWVA